MKKYLIFLVFLIPIVLLFIPENNSEENYVNYNNTYTENENIVVYVSGEVKNQGLYTFKKGAKISDLLKKCGITDLSDISGISLSEELKDNNTYTIKSKSESNTSYDISYNNIIPTNQKTELSSNLININKASISELDTLDDIGKVKASRIIEYRKVKPFDTIEEIMQVKGISSDIFNKIKDKITV